MRSKLDGPELFFWNGFLRRPDFEPLNPALTAVSSMLSLLFRCLYLLRRVLSLLLLTSGVPALLALFLLRANQLSSPTQKRVMSAVRAAMDFGSLGRGGGEPFIVDALFKGR